MIETPRKETALGVARARFVDGLGRKAAELRGAIVLLAGAPGSERSREEMRRRLHALYASAQVFRIDELAESLRDAIRRLDAARDERRPLTDDDMGALSTLAKTLPDLASSGLHTGASTLAPPAESLRAPSRVAPGSATPELAPDEFELLESMPSTIPPDPMRPSRAPIERATRPSGSFTASLQQADGTARTPWLVSVLVIDTAESQAQIRAALPVDTHEILSCATIEEGLRLARSSAPDAVLVDFGLATDTSDLIGRLRSDPLTDFVPVIALVPQGTPFDPMALREAGIDEAIPKPFEETTLRRAIERWTRTGESTAWPDALGDLTLEQLADRVAAEVRRGIVEGAESGRDMTVPLGEGAEVLAASWSAIARVRAFVSQRTGGRVRFQDGKRRGGPAFLALVEDEQAAGSGAEDVSLRGRRALIVDDDPAIVWFFAGLLREEGAEVIEASDGREALELARRRRPDVVISDILMPHVDGFALTRELRRDPMLSDIPVILLSWKEDFLARMRELQSGAAGYLRKEAGAAQILAKVREVLRPRARLEAQLGAGGEVRGNLDRIGAQTLLSTVAKERKNARIAVRDAWNLFEIDLRDGRLEHLTRTATDGSFARGPSALPPLLGVQGGRFTVADAEGPVRAQFKGDIGAVLDHAAHQLGAVVDAVSGVGLSRAHRVELDEEVLEPLLRTSPAPTRTVVEKLKTQGPRELLVGGEIAPQLLESVLTDLARRGAIRAVQGAAGEDRIAEALALRLARPDAVQNAPDPMTTTQSPGWLSPVSEYPLPISEDGVEMPPPVKIEPVPVPEIETPQLAELTAHDDPEATKPGGTSDAPLFPEPALPKSASGAPSKRPSNIPSAAPRSPSRPAPSTTPSRRPEPARDGGSSTPAIALAAIGVLMIVCVWYLWSTTTNEAPAADPPAHQASTHTTQAADAATAADAHEEPQATALEEEHGLAAQRFGRVVEGILDAGVQVPENKGLLVIEGTESGTSIALDGQSLAAGTAATALSPGVHEVSFRRGDDVSFRFLHIRAGQSVVIPGVGDTGAPSQP